MASLMVDDKTMVPDLLRQHPGARNVLDRYGMRGCGGEHGPVDSLGFFARAHGVELKRLVEEIGGAIADGRPAALAEASVADTIYRRYFIAGIVAILTVGASWGVWLLWQIGFAGNFTGVSLHEVNAHGHAQIFGWVGLFMMGFGYQAFPRMWQSTLVAPRLAVAAFVMMLVGIVVRTPAMAMHEQWWAVEAAMAGGAMQIAAIAIFVGQISASWRCSSTRFEPYLAFIFAGLGFFLLQAGFSLWHTYNTMTAGNQEELLWYVATYQAVLRDLQIHGLALFMILGVSMRMLPAFFGLPEVSARRAWTAFWLLLFAVAGECVLFVAYRWTGQHALAATLMLPWLALAAGALIVPWKWRLWRPLPEADRSAKFVRAAYAWLAASMVMLLLLPVYQVASGMAFSHAYYGSIRHAITVGFVSLMIMGIAAKVVPTLNGVDVRKLSPLWGPFVLVNVGCFLRVSLQTLTDWHPLFFAVVGVSGVLEVTGLAWWGWHLVGIMWRGRRDSGAIDDSVAEDARPPRLASHHFVADVVRWYPQTVDVLVGLGFTPIRNPMIRRTLARRVTLAQASLMGRVPLSTLLDAVNAAIDAPPAEAIASCTRDCERCACAHDHPEGTDHTLSAGASA